MTPGCEVWIASLLGIEKSIQGDVLEVGSMDINGSIRHLFANARRFPSYVGVDMRRGERVDPQAEGDALPCGDGQYGAVVALEMLEHDDHFWITLAECHRVLKCDGWLVITTRAFGFPKHEYPNDYWRFTAEGLRAVIRRAGFQYTDAVEDHDDLGVFAVARRLDADPEITRQVPGQSVLLQEAEAEMLRKRMQALIPLGITSIPDAFERVDSDRRLLKDLLESVWSETIKEALAPVLVARVERALGLAAERGHEWEDARTKGL